MAKLIKLTTKPQKYLLKRLLSTVKVNRVLSSSVITETETQLIELDHEIKRAKGMVKDFRRGKEALREKSIERGIDRSRIQLAIEVLVMVAEFSKNLKEESRAIEGLARKIMANITNSPYVDDSMNCVNEKIEAALRNTLALHIITPEEHLPQIMEAFLRFKNVLGSLISIQGKTELKYSQIMLTMLDNSIGLDIKHAYLEGILTSAYSVSC